MSKQPKTKGEIWLAIGPLGWLVRYEHTDTWMDYKAYEVVSMSMDESEKSFRRLGATGSGDETDDPDKAESLDGFVKWDGCMEIDMGRRHFCGAEDVEQYTTIVRKLHELCLLLPRVDRDCAEYAADVNKGEIDDLYINSTGKDY